MVSFCRVCDWRDTRYGQVSVGALLVGQELTGWHWAGSRTPNTQALTPYGEWATTLSRLRVILS